MKGTGKAKIISLIFLIILFIVITTLVIEKKTVLFDTKVSEVIINTIPESANKTLEIITTIGGTKILPIIVLTIVFLMILIKKQKYGVLIFANSLLSTISYVTIKRIIQRPRPNPFRFIEETGFSFPSGHATNNMAFCGILIYLIVKEVKNKALKIISIILLSLWVLVVGISRIYFNVHYVSDIIAGFTLGTICIIISTSIITANEKGKKTLNKQENNV